MSGNKTWDQSFGNSFLLKKKPTKQNKKQKNPTKQIVQSLTVPLLPRKNTLKYYLNN